VPAGKRGKELVDALGNVSLSRRAARTDTTTTDAATAPAPSVSLPDHVRARLAELLAVEVGKLGASMPDGFDGWGIA
jgi:hypothetical protein